MKKLFTILLSVFVMLSLILSFSACGRSGYINQSLSKAKEWDAVDFDVKTNIQATNADKTEDLSSEYSVKLKYLQSYDPLAMAKTKVTLYGEKVPADVYFANGSYYVVTNNDAVKLRTGTLIEGSGFVENWKSILTTLPSTAINAAEEKDNGDGIKTATMTVDVETFKTIYQNVLKEWNDKLLAMYAEGASVSDLRVSEPKISVTVDSKNSMLKSYSGECHLEFLAEFSSGELITVSIEFQQTVSCNANGKDVAFDLPEDYEEYKISNGVTLDSKEILTNAIEKALKLNAMDISLRLTLGTENISVKNVKAKGIGTDDWSFAWNESFLFNDKQVGSEVYYTKGYYYTNVYGELSHLKYERSEENDDAYGYEKALFDLVKALADSEYKSAVACSNEDGTRTFQIELPSTRFQKVYGNLITDAKDVADFNGTVTVSDAYVELIVDKKGTLKSYNVSFSLTSKDQGSQNFSYGVTFNDFGENVLVAPLEGYEMFFLATERKQEFFGNVEKAIADILGADSLNAYIFYSQFVDSSVIKIDKNQESVTAAVNMQTNPKHYTKFMIKFDDVSGRYFSIISRRIDEPKTARNLLSLVSSANLSDWELVCDLIDRRNDDPKMVGFQYVDFEIEGDDIIYLCRTAMNNAKNYHDANYSTFHRIEKFRSLL